MKDETNCLWLQTLDVLKKLGAPEPTYLYGGPYRVAVFIKGGACRRRWYSETVDIAIDLGEGHVGVVATDLFRAGIITLSEEAANRGGVPSMPLDSYTAEVIASLKGDKTYPHERFGI